MAEFCPSCGTQRLGAFQYCRSCGFDYDAAQPTAAPTAEPPPAVLSQEPSDRQQLARAAMTAQTVNLAVIVGAGIGAVVGFLLPGYFAGSNPDGEFAGALMIAAVTIGPLIGVFVGGRVALMLIAR